MEKLIYCCAFGDQERYAWLAASLLVSLEASESCGQYHFLVYTTKEGKDCIEAIVGRSSRCRFWITTDEKAHPLKEASWARYEIFDWPEIGAYDELLYLDTDIVVTGDLGKVFSNFALSATPISAFNETGSTLRNDKEVFRGLTIFLNEGVFHKYQDARVFSTGVLIFRNTSEVKQLFREARSFKDSHLSRYPPDSGFMDCDQPYINYLAIRRGLVSTEALVGVVRNNPKIRHENSYLIAHFAGGVGNKNKPEKVRKYYAERDNVHPLIKDFLVATGDTGTKMT